MVPSVSKPPQIIDAKFKVIHAHHPKGRWVVSFSWRNAFWIIVLGLGAASERIIDALSNWNR